MSVCISQHGEYSSHTLDTEYMCTRCGVLDEDALVAELRYARAEFQRLTDWIYAHKPTLIGADPVAAVLDTITEAWAENGRVRGHRNDLRDRLDAAEAERDRMRPVVEAAEMLVAYWKKTFQEPMNPLVAAVDAYRSATSGQPVDDRSPESYCHRCGGPNISWSAPSPLWNAVMRGGSINGPMEFDEIICPLCFAALAIERGVAGAHWRFFANDVQAELELVTPTGRVWSSTTWLWETPGEARRGGPIDVLGHAPVRLHPEPVEKEVSNVDVP